MEYDIELIDVSESIENFKFHKISKEDLEKTINSLKDITSKYLEFTSLEGRAVLEKSYFRGILYAEHIKIIPTINQENKDSAVEVSKVTLKKNVFSGVVGGDK